MNYNRTLKPSFSKLLEPKGELRWLFEYVKSHPELDFQIGKSNSKEWISVYRGLSRFLTIHPTSDTQVIKIDGANEYKKLSSGLYGKKTINDNFQDEIEQIISIIEKDTYFDRYYNNRKEGYYQNEFSRRFGICGHESDDFVIIDKEVVIGYADQKEKNDFLSNFSKKYKQLQVEISTIDAKLYGKDLQKKAIGNELDFLALDKDGNLLLIEFKDGNNASGIYLSPLQIGMYYDIFTNYPKMDLQATVFEMLEQKQRIGLINPDWKKPAFIKEIIPVLVISEYNYKSSAQTRFNEILQITRNRLGSGFLGNLKTLNFSLKNGLSIWLKRNAFSLKN